MIRQLKATYNVENKLSANVLSAETISPKSHRGESTIGTEVVMREKTRERGTPISKSETSIDATEQSRVVDSDQSPDLAQLDSAPVSQARSFTRDLVELSKPRIVVMILVTTVATAMIAAGGMVSPVAMLVLLMGTGLVAASAGAANQIWERSIDREMSRTASRPLPDGRLGLPISVTFTALTGIVGTAILWNQFAAAPALAGMATWVIYVLVYTPMKTRTAWNTTVGAIAGALPMLIGYTAFGGTFFDTTAWLLVGVLVAWQFPHFMAIAWMYRRQYGEAGFCMTTTVDPSGRSAGWQSVVGSIALIASGIALCIIPTGLTGAIIASVAVVACCYPMLRASIQFAKKRDDVSARKLLRSSLLVLPAILLVVTLRVFW